MAMEMYRIVKQPNVGYVVERQTPTWPAHKIQTCATYEIALAVCNAVFNSAMQSNRDAVRGKDLIS
jgi:hypothetical protein